MRLTRPASDLCLGFDTMADFGLGVKLGLLRSSDRDFVFPALYFHEKKMGLWEQLPLLSNMGFGSLVGTVFPLISSQAGKFANWYQSFLDEAVALNTHKSHGIFGPVIQSGLGKMENPGHNHRQMITEGSFSTFSSADAYGIMLSGFFHYLSHYPCVYQKLAAEMRAMYAPGDDIVWDAGLESNTYLRAVIFEVMRLLPPACGVHWRECEREGFPVGPPEADDGVGAGAGVGPVPMALGTDVGMSLFSIFRDGRIYREPVRFWPERWIAGNLPDAELSMAKKMFVPFLIGPRNCAGSHVAMMMGSIAYAYILVNFDFRFGPEQRQVTQSQGRSHLVSNTPRERGADSELIFESHYSIAGWESGPFIQFQARGEKRQ